MRLYHGCASYQQVSKEGLVYDPERSNDFGEGDYLQSCGGTYLSDSLEVAAFYADNAVNGEGFMGDDPCVFAVDVDDDLLIVDEDKAWDAIRVIVEHTIGERLWDDTDAEEANALLDEFLARHGATVVEQVVDKFRLGKEDGVLAAVRAFLLRATCFDWSVRQPGFEAELAAINAFCASASGTISRHWFREHYDDFAVTCRTLVPIAPMGTDGPARIVGSIRLVMGELGLSVEAIEFDGAFDEEDALDFQDSFIEKAESRSGCEIVSCETCTGSHLAA